MAGLADVAGVCMGAADTARHAGTGISLPLLAWIPAVPVRTAPPRSATPTGCQRSAAFVQCTLRPLRCHPAPWAYGPPGCRVPLVPAPLATPSNKRSSLTYPSSMSMSMNPWCAGLSNQMVTLMNKFRLVYWRTPSYNYVRLVMTVVCSLVRRPRGGMQIHGHTWRCLFCTQIRVTC